MTGPVPVAALIAIIGLLGSTQAGRLWSFEERRAESDLVVVARVITSSDTGHSYEPTTGHMFPTHSVYDMVEGRMTRATPQETYVSAEIDPEGRLAIVATSGRPVTVRPSAEQTAFWTPVISTDRTAVAAQAMFSNCCTSYDLPLALVVYYRGVEHRFTGNGTAMFQFGFAGQGQVAYGQQPPHFACAIHYELRNIASERLIESIDVPEPCGDNPNPDPVEIPDWVARLRSR